MAHMATILTDDGTYEVEAVARPGTLLVPEGALPGLTGWQLNPEGLCRGDVCVPTRSRPELRVDDRIDLQVVAELLAQPLVVDDDTATAALGASSTVRAEQLADGRVDDLALRDVDGNAFAWAGIGRKKKVLVTWASW